MRRQSVLWPASVEQTRRLIGQGQIRRRKKPGSCPAPRGISKEIVRCEPGRNKVCSDPTARLVAAAEIHPFAQFRQTNFVTQIGGLNAGVDQPFATERGNLAVGSERVRVGNNTNGNGPLCRQSAAPSSAGSETSIATGRF